jgi:hypothetical protein
MKDKIYVNVNIVPNCGIVRSKREVSTNDSSRPNLHIGVNGFTLACWIQ